MDPVVVDAKWQRKWDQDNIFKSNNVGSKQYILEMYPYPSGTGLHMGHAFNYTIGDVYARHARMKGLNVLYPMGYDSFGLPAENAAINANTHPRPYTQKAIAYFISQQKALGISYDWSRMLSSCDPAYYKWNQYLFLMLWNKGLVYRKKAPVNWCLECKSVLANEQVHEGMCWRHKDTEVEKKELEQWFIKTTQYAEELLEKIDTLNWPDRIKTMQKNWIGKSQGMLLSFDVVDSTGKVIDSIETFTTRPDTVFGITYIVLAPEHPKIRKWVSGTRLEHSISEFVKSIEKLTTIERTAEGKEKKGVFLGCYVVNPFTGENCPLWAADYALYDYGTGAVMAVPAHDQRDFEFAKKYNLPLKVVIAPSDGVIEVGTMTSAFIGPGILVNSQQFDGQKNEEAMKVIARFAESKSFGKRTTQYRLKDWLVSRQRYWGTPIPAIHCPGCGVVKVPTKELPILLPEDVTFGEGNPLETSASFIRAQCPSCGKDAKRETDTMDTFFDSSWYFLRFTDPHNETQPFDKKIVDSWMPVSQYIGGAEHACMHLIYARFFTKALRDMGFLSFDEPFSALFNQGMIHGEDGYVMSKSRGNVIDPKSMIEKYGADVVRFYLVSVAGPDKDMEWSSTGIEGSQRFIRRVIEYYETVSIGKSLPKAVSRLHTTIRKVSENISTFKYNVAIIEIRSMFESMEPQMSEADLCIYLQLLHPFCPHITEELWEQLGNSGYISLSSWPIYDESKIDHVAEAQDSFVKRALDDVREVLALIQIEKPLSITLIIAPKWKYELLGHVKKNIDSIHNPVEMLQSVMQTDLKKYGKEISKIIPSLLKDRSKIPEKLLDQEQESQADFAPLRSEYLCTITVEIAEQSEHEKARHALPGKPAIVIGSR